MKLNTLVKSLAMRYIHCSLTPNFIIGVSYKTINASDSAVNVTKLKPKRLFKSVSLFMVR